MKLLKKYHNSFFNYLLDSVQTICYLTNTNLLCRQLYFVSDPSHLVKTTRNNLLSSKPGGTRYLWNGSEMAWSIISNLYHDVSAAGPESLTSLHKLTIRHIYPNTFDKMKVRYAAQILSSSVANAVKEMGHPIFAKFIRMMNQFFDICNSSIGQRSPLKAPFYYPDDSRLIWLESTFVVFFVKWEENVKVRRKRNGECFTEAEKQKMKLSKATHEGLVFTALSLVGITRSLLAAGAEYVIMRRISQDVLEAFFGNVRESGGYSKNPNMKEFNQRMHAINFNRSLKRKYSGNVEVDHT